MKDITSYVKQEFCGNVKLRYKDNPSMKQFEEDTMLLARGISKRISKIIRERSIPVKVEKINYFGDKTYKVISLRNKDGYFFLQDYKELVHPDDLKDKTQKFSLSDRYDNPPITPTEMRDHPLWFKDIFQDFEKAHGQLNLSLSVSLIEGILNRWLVQVQRNKKQGNLRWPPRVDFSKRAFNYKKCYFSYDFSADTMTFKGLRKELITLEIDKDKSILHHFDKWRNKIESKKGKKFGANIVFHQNQIVALIEVEKFCYKPVTGNINGFNRSIFWGPDLNKTPDFFLAFPKPLNGKSYFERSGEYLKQEELANEIHDALKKMDEVPPEKRANTHITFKGIQLPCNRRGRRKLVELKNKSIKKRRSILNTDPIIDEMINFIKANQFGFALDTVKTGQSHGSWGQDIFQHVIKERSRKDYFPIMEVPAAWTSSQCRKCGHKDRKNVSGKGREDFKCTKCGHEAIAHIEAANNISEEAGSLWDKMHQNSL